MNELLTIVIPTMNRPEFLKRALTYYSSESCPYRMMICDSSTGEKLDSNIETISYYQHELKITHIYNKLVRSSTRKASGWQEDPLLEDVMSYIDTPYVAFFADDDFAVTTNFQTCLQILEDNPDISFVCGEAAIFEITMDHSKEITYGDVNNITRYAQRSVSENSAIGRLSSLLLNYNVLEYGISRTEQMSYRWSKIYNAKLDNLSSELLNCSLVVIQGKVKKIDKLTLVRQAHSLMTSRIGKDEFEWFSSVFFPKSFQSLFDIVVHDLSDKDGISYECAYSEVKRIFWRYTHTSLSRKYIFTYNTSRTITSKILAFLREMYKKGGLIFYIVRMMRYIYSLYYSSSGHISINTVSMRSSPFHADLSRVIKVISNK